MWQLLYLQRQCPWMPSIPARRWAERIWLSQPSERQHSQHQHQQFRSLWPQFLWSLSRQFQCLWWFHLCPCCWKNPHTNGRWWSQKSQPLCLSLLHPQRSARSWWPCFPRSNNPWWPCFRKHSPWWLSKPQWPLPLDLVSHRRSCLSRRPFHTLLSMVIPVLLGTQLLLQSWQPQTHAQRPKPSPVPPQPSLLPWQVSPIPFWMEMPPVPC